MSDVLCMQEDRLMEGVLNKAMALALAGEHQLLTARRTPDAASGLLRGAARYLREAADLADACREGVGEGMLRDSRPLPVAVGHHLRG